MLKNKNTPDLKSEYSVHFPNVNSLMKISLGLILFTILSTALVYGEISPENNLTLFIFENAYLESSGKFIDQAMISVDSGSSITIINNDVVSHIFVSGVSNQNQGGTTDYDDFLVCEFGEEIKPDVTKGGGFDNICNFNKDNRIVSSEILPGDSVSIPITDVGTYRIIDPNYPWMELLIYSFPKSENEPIIDEPKITSIPVVTKSIQNISVNVGDVSFNVPYSTAGMTVSDIESDFESMSLIFSVNVIDSTGKLDVQFDRSFFDSIYDGVDDSFFILADGDETIFREIQTNSQSRSLVIDVPLGTEELEVIGSIFQSSKIIEAPVIEAPVIEAPVIEAPVIEAPESQNPSTNQCGPGTVLEGDACVIDPRCGPGTVLEGDACVVDSTIQSSTSTSSTSSGNSKELIISITAGFVIAGIVGIILALIAKANKNKN